MYCDSAAYNEKTQTIKAYGNVQVQKGDINLYCDSFYYKTSVKSPSCGEMFVFVTQNTRLQPTLLIMMQKMEKPSIETMEG